MDSINFFDLYLFYTLMIIINNPEITIEYPCLIKFKNDSKNEKLSIPSGMLDLSPEPTIVLYMQYYNLTVSFTDFKVGLLFDSGNINYIIVPFSLVIGIEIKNIFSFGRGGGNIKTSAFMPMKETHDFLNMLFKKFLSFSRKKVDPLIRDEIRDEKESNKDIEIIMASGEKREEKVAKEKEKEKSDKNVISVVNFDNIDDHENE